MTLLKAEMRLARNGFVLDIAESLPLKLITAVFGPNGSGKTTFLRCLAGLEPQASCSISFGAEQWAAVGNRQSMPVHHRPIGMVFQHPVLFDHLNVEQNLNYAVRRARKTAEPIPVDEVVAAFDLINLLDRRVWELSGGERQRVAMGRALLRQPRLLLMDEPLAALDLVRRAEALSYIEQIPVRFGVPVLYVTHSIDEVVRLADDIILMDAGQIVAHGPLADMLSRLDLPPLTGRFEAGGVLLGQVVAQDDRLRLTRIDLGDSLYLEVPELPLDPGEELRLRIRARDVAIAKQPPLGLSIRNVLACRIEEIAEETDTAFAEVRLLIAQQPLRARITRASVEHLALKAGDQAYALIKSVALDRRMLSSKKRPG